MGRAPCQAAAAVRLAPLELRIRGQAHTIHWPPETDEEWEVVARYLDLADEILHEMRRAIVSLEKKCHWGMPTRPVLRRRCPYRCVDEDGQDVDPTDENDEGDGSGAGSGQQNIDWE
jgi:hypothetical protein